MLVLYEKSFNFFASRFLQNVNIIKTIVKTITHLAGCVDCKLLSVRSRSWSAGLAQRVMSPETTRSDGKIY